MNGIFGWSYPPGCSGPPDESDADEPEGADVDAELLEQCDPYGSLEFVIGSADDFVCFDYAIDSRANRVCLASTVNSETGSFIQNFAEPIYCSMQDAPRHARDLVSQALEWACDDPPIRLDMKGWNQDPAYFIRAVDNAVSKKPRRVARRVRNWYRRAFS